MAYDDAIATLYQSSQAQFVAERKRLALELKASGDKAGAARLAKLARPTLSAWAVNQLWWHARAAFEALLASSERLRHGDRGATAAHREALLSLRGRAALLLTDAGHAVTDGTLRRVSTTLTALAATGSFAPDAPGALAADRDPPGFEALGSVTNWSAAAEPRAGAEASSSAEPDAAGSGGAPAAAAPVVVPLVTAPRAARADGVAPSNELRGAPERDGGTGRADAECADAERRQASEAAAHAEAERQHAETERRRTEAAAAARLAAQRLEEEAKAAAKAAAHAEAERRRAEERARREAARAELDAALERARAEFATGEREVVRLRTELVGAEGRVARARTRLRELEARSVAFGAVE